MPSKRKGWLMVPGTPGASGETTDTIAHSATEEVVWVEGRLTEVVLAEAGRGSGEGDSRWTSGKGTSHDSIDTER
jgi:hypothetical protein